MLKSFQIFVMILIISSSLISQQINWISTAQPYGGDISSITIGDSAMFCISGMVVFRSSTYGETWNKCESLIPEYINGQGNTRLFLNSLGYIFASDGFSYITLRSTNNGKNWESIGKYYIMYMDARGYLYARTGDKQLLISTDYGDSFMNTGFTLGISSDVVLNESNQIFVSTNYDKKGIFRSTNGGFSWVPVNNGLGLLDINALAYYNNYLFAGSQDGKVYRSGDNGDSWQEIFSVQNKDGTRPRISQIVANKNLVAIIAGDDVYLSTDLGDKWTIIWESGTNLFLNFPRSLAVDETSLYITSAKGIAYYNISNKTFEFKNNGITAVRFAKVNINQNGLILLTSTIPNGLYYCFNNSNSFTQLPTPFIISYISPIISDKDNNILIGTNTGIFRTSDFGQSWINDSLVVYAQNFFFSNPGKILAGTTKGIYLSSDNGINWKTVADLNHEIISFTYTDSTQIYAYGENKIYKSLDQGLTWNPVAFAPFTYPTIGIYGNKNGDLFSPGIGLYKSTDNGINWIKIKDKFNHEDDNITWFEIIPNGDIYVGTDKAVYLSKDNGNSWLEIGTDVPFVKSSTQGSNTIYVCSDNYYLGSELKYFFTDSINTNVNSFHTPNYGYLLSQNYPNPFNPDTKISYSIPISCIINLKVFNLLGQEVESLVNEERSPGTYEANFDASDLPSGIYIYKLQAGDFIQTKKMILLK